MLLCKAELYSAQSGHGVVGLLSTWFGPKCMSTHAQQRKNVCAICD